MKKIKAVLFDLDGTLLPMDQDAFMRSYFGRLSALMQTRGYEPRAFMNALRQGTLAMLKNDGSVTNEDAYWARFCDILGKEARAEIPVLEEFYKSDFENVRESCGYDPDASRAVRALRAMGIRTVLATNPLFPAVATRARIRWAGLSEEDFEFFTSYENSSFTKPSLNYYRMILERMGLCAEECLMAGNDVDEDMIAQQLGMRVFLIEKCLINKSGKDTESYPRGTLCGLLSFIEKINKQKREGN